MLVGAIRQGTPRRAASTILSSSSISAGFVRRPSASPLSQHQRAQFCRRSRPVAFRSSPKNQTASSVKQPMVRPPPPCTKSLQEASTPKSASSELAIERHGPKDGVICLNVGGTEFRTLRSTISTNPVLARYVACAEANQELTSSGNAVFVDRDPKLFGIILTFLRNKVEGVSYNSKNGKLNPKKTPQYVRLPTSDKGNEVLRDLWVEAMHFQIPELVDQICHKSWFLQLSSTIAPGGNPFQSATSILNGLRGTAVAFAGGGSLLTILTYDFEQMSGVKVPDSIKKDMLGLNEKDLQALEAAGVAK